MRPSAGLLAARGRVGLGRRGRWRLALRLWLLGLAALGLPLCGRGCGGLLSLPPRLLLGLPPGALLGLPALLLLALSPGALLLGPELGVALRSEVPHGVDDQLAGPDGVVVARNHVVDRARVAVRVDEADDRDLQPRGLADGDVLGLQVDHEHGVGRPLHPLHASEVHLEFVALSLGRDPLTRRQQLEGPVLGPREQVVEALDPLRDRLEVRQQAAEPALVDVGHAGLVGRLLDRVTGLLLGAHEHDRAAAPRDARRELLGVLKQTIGLLEVDDVYPVALSEDEPPHLRIPPARLVPEVDSRLEQVGDRYVRHTAPFSLGATPAAGARTRPSRPGGPSPAPRGRLTRAGRIRAGRFPKG